MANKPKRSDQPRRNKRLLISAVAIFLIIISILTYASILHQPAGTQPTPQGKRASSEYFIISDVAGTYKRYGNKNSTDPNPGASVRITTLGFQFKPIGGPATDVAIFMEGMEDPTNHYWAGITIPNGTSVYSGDIQPTYSLYSQRNQDDGTYRLTIRINCLEADGDIVLIFTAGKNLYGV